MRNGATEHGLLNSNQRWRLVISDRVAPKTVVSASIDRRAIPEHAVESIWTAADGHELRRIDWSGAGDADDPSDQRGSILFFPGRGDNYEKYLETLEEWYRAGWRVTAADWRGQAGSGRLGKDRVTGHIDDFGIWIDDLAHFWKDWKANTNGPHVLAAHSMGGHLCLRGVIEQAVDPDALVLIAPMLGFVGRLPVAIGHSAAKLMNSLGDSTRPAWKWSEKPGQVPASRQRLLTHDDARYADELWWREERPELVMGPGSWGWVERAYASMRAMFAIDSLENVQTPVLIVGTSADMLVGIHAIEEATRRLPRAELVRFGEEARHEILRVVDPVRDRAMSSIAAFLDRAAPHS